MAKTFDLGAALANAILGDTFSSAASANKDGSSPRRESENNAAQLSAEATGCPEGLKFHYWTAQLMLVSGVNFPIEIAKV